MQEWLWWWSSYPCPPRVYEGFTYCLHVLGCHLAWVVAGLNPGGTPIRPKMPLTVFVYHKEFRRHWLVGRLCVCETRNWNWEEEQEEEEERKRWPRPRRFAGLSHEKLGGDLGNGSMMRTVTRTQSMKQHTGSILCVWSYIGHLSNSVASHL